MSGVESIDRSWKPAVGGRAGWQSPLGWVQPVGLLADRSAPIVWTPSKRKVAEAVARAIGSSGLPAPSSGDVALRCSSEGEVEARWIGSAELYVVPLGDLMFTGYWAESDVGSTRVAALEFALRADRSLDGPRDVLPGFDVVLRLDRGSLARAAL